MPCLGSISPPFHPLLACCLLSWQSFSLGRKSLINFSSVREREKEREKPVRRSVHPRCGLAGVRSDAIAWDDQTIAECRSRDKMALKLSEGDCLQGLPLKWGVIESYRMSVRLYQCEIWVDFGKYILRYLSRLKTYVQTINWPCTRRWDLKELMHAVGSKCHRIAIELPSEKTGTCT